MTIDRVELWFVIAALAVGSFGLRFIFTGVIGDRQMPDWLLRHLRFTAVSVLPALVAPLVVWPAATGGDLDPARLGAAMVALAAGLITRNTLAAIGAGVITLLALIALTG